MSFLPPNTHQRHNLHTLGLHLHQRPKPDAPRVPAPAARATTPVNAQTTAELTKLLAGLLNVESAAGFMSTTPNFSPQMRADIADVAKAAGRINRRMMHELHAEDMAVVNTLNSRGNLLDRVAILLMHCPEEVAQAAADALATVVTRWVNPPAPRPARRRKIAA